MIKELKERKMMIGSADQIKTIQLRKSSKRKAETQERISKVEMEREETNYSYISDDSSVADGDSPNMTEPPIVHQSYSLKISNKLHQQTQARKQIHTRLKTGGLLIVLATAVLKTLT